MCRNIKTLFNFDPPVTDEEIRAASLQFVRKLSGFNKPSKANEAAFNVAIDEIAAVASKLMAALETAAPARNCEEEAAKARWRSTMYSGFDLFTDNHVIARYSNPANSCYDSTATRAERFKAAPTICASKSRERLSPLITFVRTWQRTSKAHAKTE